MSGAVSFAMGTHAAITSSATYTITPSTTTPTRGLSATSGVTFNVTTTGVPNGTTIYWTNSGTSTSGEVIQPTATTTTICATAAENAGATLTLPSSSYYFTAVNFASYGNPSGSCGSFSVGSCNSANSVSVTNTAVLYKNSSVTVSASNTNFGGDPCSGVTKSLAIQTTATLYQAVSSDSFTINNNSGSFTIQLAGYDNTVGIAASTFIPQLRTGSTSGPIVKTSATVNLPAIAQWTLICATASEGGTLSITAPAGKTFTSIQFASYGTPSGTCGAYATGSCHSPNSLSVVQAALIGKTGTQTIAATNTNFGGDPCSGTAKSLYVAAYYG